MRSILKNHRYRRDARTLEDEEEMWFNTDEDDMEDGGAVVFPFDETKNDDDIMDVMSKFHGKEEIERK
ncbi:serine/threonine-protein phosphatase 4 regulatory subunit 3A [Cricetulus griseus]|uniref:Serine/threonine-protein phosphatase 4 regulatory subunit 3A n=1 Tax=Cricetulus griseus TaxID=10029 RepID=A0A061ICP3_CRIGR|nr:serine/threonine-protein phosphatase 4 regulatory subunit 3A [Cricetulus griseus]